MTIPKITPYTGGVANPDGSQTQTEFTQNMFDQLSYEANLSTELNNTVDGINDTANQVDADATRASQSTFGTAERALQSIAETKDKAELPDVVLLDLMLPGMSGLDAIPLFKQRTPDTHLLVLSQSDKEADVLRAISSGASGYLLKNASLNAISDGIRTVMAGGASLDASVAKFILDSMRKQRPDAGEAARLTKREIKV